MGTFISASDLSPFVTIETSKANAMIADAEAQATLIAPCISDLVVGTDDTKLAFVKAILRSAILRWDEAGSGGVQTVQQGAGPFQQMTVTSSKPRVGRFWPSEIEQLQGLCATNSGAFGLDTAPSQSGAHAPWCSLVFSATYCSCGSDIAGYPIYEMGCAVNLPTPFTLKIRTYQKGATDSHGNPVDSWTTGTDWKVYGYASGANDEPDQPGRDLSMVLWTVYAPASGLPGRMDLVTLDGVDYAIEGEPRDYSHDPWGHGVGQGVVYLKAVDG